MKFRVGNKVRFKDSIHGIAKEDMKSISGVITKLCNCGCGLAFIDLYAGTEVFSKGEFESDEIELFEPRGHPLTKIFKNA